MKFVHAFAVLLILFIISGIASAKDICLECHKEKTPGIVDYWKKSRHAAENVSCVSCHGEDVSVSHKKTAAVDALKCGECHKRAFADHSLSKHAIGLKSGRGCTRNLETLSGQPRSCFFCHEEGSTKPKVFSECAMFLAQSPEMQRQGCDSCHKVENRCDSCHTRHGTDISAAKDPGTCGTCHMGPDHAQLEMWETSAHGVLYRQGKGGPSCVTCHMKGGSHNVSRGIATGISDTSGLLKKQERNFMIDICATCHTRSMSGRSLEDADAVEKQSYGYVSEAHSVLLELDRESLLLPSADQRPAHPLFGKKIVIGPHMLYENLSAAESIYFRMKQFYYMNAVKGAFHQNPDYTHWYGNAPLKLALSELKSEASLLRSVDLLRKRLDNLAGSVRPEGGEESNLKQRLRDLHDRRFRGEITEKDFLEQKDMLLKERGL